MTVKKEIAYLNSIKKECRFGKDTLALKNTMEWKDPYPHLKESVMFQRLIMIGLVGMSLVAILVTKTNAQISGWGVFGYSELQVEIDLKKVKNPAKFPSILVVTGTLNGLEFLCLNPQNHNVAPGKAGTRMVSGVDQISEGNITKPGAATVRLAFSIDELEDDFACNTNWIVVHGSGAADDVTLLMEWYRCTSDPAIDPEPCFADNNADNLAQTNLTVDFTAPIDRAKAHCTLDTVLRDENGIPLPNQEFDCPEIPL